MDPGLNSGAASGLLVRFRPAGPWRLGPSDGERTSIDPVWRSDSLFAAVCDAMRALGDLESWLDATVHADSPEVVLSSGYPFLRDILFVSPPRTLWPPAQASRLRCRAARLAPLSLLADLVAGKPLDDDRWWVDPASGCLLPVERSGPLQPPLRAATRTGIAVDRVQEGKSVPYFVRCAEFAPGAGMWCAAAFRDSAASGRWTERLQGCFRYLGDHGVGGERSRGWGRSREVDFQAGSLSGLGLPGANGDPAGGWWLLSLFSPSTADEIDWSQGNYSVIIRSGRSVEGELKRRMRMVEEGSVIVCAARPKGSAPDSAAEGASHPRYRAGFAFALALDAPAGVAPA